MKLGRRKTTLPLAAFRDNRVKPLDLRLLAELDAMDDNNGWVVGVAGLMAVTGASRPRLIEAIKRLVAFGYVERDAETVRTEAGRRAHRHRVRLDLSDAEVVEAASPVPKREPVDTSQVPVREPVERSPVPKREREGIPTPSPDQAETSAKSGSSDDDADRNPLPFPNGNPSLARVRDTFVVSYTTGHNNNRCTALPRVSARDCAERLCAEAGHRLRGMAVEPGLTQSLGAIARWLRCGCDFELDVVPVVAGITRRAGGPITTWGYFDRAVFQARDQRLAAPPDPTTPSPADGGPHAAGRPASARPDTAFVDALFDELHGLDAHDRARDAAARDRGA